MSTNKIPVYGRFDSKAADGVVAEASQVLDVTENMSQSDLNANLKQSISTNKDTAEKGISDLKKEVIEKLKVYLSESTGISITGPGTDEYPAYQIAIVSTAIDLFSNLVLSDGALTLTTTKGTTKTVTKDQFTAQLGIDALSTNLTDLTTVFNNFLQDADVTKETINTWKEIENFLAGITDSQTLTGILESQYNKITGEYQKADEEISKNLTEANEEIEAVKTSLGYDFLEIAVTVKPDIGPIVESTVAKLAYQIINIPPDSTTIEVTLGLPEISSYKHYTIVAKDVYTGLAFASISLTGTDVFILYLPEVHPGTIKLEIYKNV